MKETYNLAGILGVQENFLREIDLVMSTKTGRNGVLERVEAERNESAGKVLASLNAEKGGVSEVRRALREAVLRHEGQLLGFLGSVAGGDKFERMASLSRSISSVDPGFFLKKEKAVEILEKRPPVNVLSLLGYKKVSEMLKRENVLEVFSALRFMESNQWMHETFEEAYGEFTAADFEEREIEINVLGPQWAEVSKKFVAKKHHNVSHLKEFGVIFLNPIEEDTQGKFIRDFALLLHYFHEISFYAKLFRRAIGGGDFASRLKSLLRGDVKEVKEAQSGEWLVVQRYLWKENPKDPRLFLPRVNPESLHWSRAEKDLARFSTEKKELDLELWENLDWVAFYDDSSTPLGASPFDRLRTSNDNGLVSFDLEDNAMAAVSYNEGKEEYFSYHQREALWTKLFTEYAGGEEKMEKLLIENFQEGVIKF